MDNKISWIFKLKKEVPLFMEKMKGDNKGGYYKYSLTGDLFDEDYYWGLGNTVFAIKIYYTLNLLKELDAGEKEKMSKFILSFQKKDNSFSDPLMRRKAFLKNFFHSLLSRNFNNLLGEHTVRAETRQAISALKLLRQEPQREYQRFPQNKKEINKYLSKLNWEKPWGAGSHFSHLLFFLNNSKLRNKDDLINYAINWINKLQDEETGSWFKRCPNMQQKVNGAMKIITGSKVANKVRLKYPKKLIDLCLKAKNNSHACDNFNIVYVLKYANEETRGNYKFYEIKDFCYNRLEIYKKYYYPDIRGFSFKLNQASNNYYGAKITKGFDEPDIHGTVMFLWGISIISQILGINKKLEFNEFKP